MKNFLLIDGNSIMNRAFYGIMSSNLMQNKEGKYTNADIFAETIEEGVYSQGFIDLISASTISVRLYSESDMYHATGSVDDNGKYKITIGS